MERVYSIRLLSGEQFFAASLRESGDWIELEGICSGVKDQHRYGKPLELLSIKVRSKSVTSITTFSPEKSGGRA